MDHAPGQKFNPHSSNFHETPRSDLRSFSIPIPEIFNYKNENTLSVPVIFDGATLELRIRTTNFTEKPPKPLTITLVVLKEPKTELKDRSASLYVVLEKIKGGLKGTVAVQNEEFKKLRELGRTLFTISLRLMQQFADKWNLPVTHFARRKPFSGLSHEKWDELILPILESNQYIQDSEDNDLWEKTYLPTQK